MSRLDNSIRNSSVALFGQVATIFLNFIVRTIFIKFLDISYLGINGLFSNVLSILSFAELGFGTAITYALYKPIAEQDITNISRLMNFYKKVYTLIGFFILSAGILLVPYLNFFIGDVSELPTNLPPLWIIYILYLINTSTSYFFNYKRSFIIANQMGYIDTFNTLLFNLLKNISQILILMIFRSYLLFLIIQILFTFLSNYIISKKANNLFPFLKEIKQEKLNKSQKKKIYKNVIGMSSHKLGAVVVNGTDNILISKYVGIIATGIYSNYYLITNMLRTVYLQIFNPLVSSVGNLLVKENDNENNFLYFKRIQFLNSIIAIYFSIGILYMSSSFIKMVWGEKFIFSKVIIYILVLNFFLTCMRQTLSVFMDASGLFWELKWKSIVESIINLCSSLLFVKYFRLGVMGVMLGTTVSTLLTNFWWEPVVVFKNIFEDKLKDYWLLYLKSCLVFITIVLILYFFPIIDNTNNLIIFILKGCYVTFVYLIVILIFYFRTDDLHYFYNVIKTGIKKIKKRSVL